MKIVTRNKSARFNYQILETYEAGISLTGTEIKSIRANKVSLDEAYVLEKHGELFLVNANIPEYVQGNQFNHIPTRPRKLLVKKSEISKIAIQSKRDGLTVIPISLYFKDRWVKLEIGIGKGKNKRDKREDINKKDAQREIARSLKHTSG